MNNKQKVLLIGVGVLAIAGAGYWAYENKEKIVIKGLLNG